MLKIEHVSKVYRIGNQDFTALNDVDLEIDPGAFMSFVGPSGSGKTTLLNLLGGLDKPTRGHIRFRHYRLDEMSREELAEVRRKYIGFIFQSYNLLPVYSVYENILFPLLLNNEKEDRVRQQILDIIHAVGLDAEKNKKPSELSGGQCQRVAIARALVKKPDVVLADEPTANLDTENSLKILELMRELNRDYEAAFIFSTHDEKVTRYVNREVRLEDGRVISDQVKQETQA